jgi:UDP-N-acetylmuramate dehydrogenase
MTPATSMTTWRDEIARRVRGEVARDAPLSGRTAIRLGGPADLLVRPADPDDLAIALRACRELAVPLLVLGGGANLLVSDRGVRGVVLKLPPGFGEAGTGDFGEAGTEGFGEAGKTGTRLVLSAGAPTSRLVARAQKLGLVGCEFVAGIPGTLGGAVAMNAGTRAGEMKDVVRRVELATADGAGWVGAGELAFGYRTSRLPPGAVVTRLEIELRPGDVVASAAVMRADVERRRATQPLTQPTLGSTFRNPPGAHAGQLIEAVGLKGHRLGNAAWSDVHANFIVNLGEASTRDVLGLVRLARRRVEERFGILLEPEVRLAGEFADDEGIA